MSTLDIRAATAADADGVLSVYGPIVRESAISFEDELPSRDEIQRRIEASHAWLVALEGGHFTGYAYASRFHERSAYRWSVEVSVYLAPEARGRGIGTQLLRALLFELREMGFVNAFAGSTMPNPGSVALFESLGFRRVAEWERVGFKLGAWHDVAWWQLRLREPDAPPREPGPAR